MARACRQFPITLIVSITCVGMFVATQAIARSRDIPHNDAQRVLGAPASLIYVAHPDLGGLLEVWDGQWWRIPLGVLHHSGVPHLFFNMIGFVVLGSLLEPRLGWLRYILFLVISACVSMLPEALLENAAIGISGPLCAMFGALIIVRPRDRGIQKVLTPTVIELGLLWVVLCIPLTALRFLNIANLAHFGGLLYGALYARVLLTPWGTRRARMAFHALHLLLIPAFYFAQSPLWLARYHWHLALTAEQPSQELRHLRETVRRNPALGDAWVMLAHSHLANDDLPSAWRSILQGVHHNRSENKAVELARGIWVEQVFHGRASDALKVLREIFGGEFDTWQPKLAPYKITLGGDDPESAFDDPFDGLLADDADFARIPARTPRLILQDEPWAKSFPADFPQRSRNWARPSAPDPDDPNSAAEGMQI